MTQPDISLADESTGILDTARSREIMEFLAQLNHEEAITVIMVTNEEGNAEYGDRIVQFVDGRIASDSQAGRGLAISMSL